MFHEIDQDKIDRVRGFDITVVTTAKNDDEGRALLKALGFPFRSDDAGQLVLTLSSQSIRPPLSTQVGIRVTDAETGRDKEKQLMTMTDPVADLLTRLRNANSAYHDTVSLPQPQAQVAHRRDPQDRGLHRRRGRSRTLASAQTLTIDLKYGPNRERSIVGIKRVSKPGLRVYAKSTEIPKVLGGLGVAILSTSSGLLTDRQADEEGRGWGSPRLRVVIQSCHVLEDSPSTSPPGST